ncbi:hypothetical protein BDD12DRAFT_853601 [Trichophaea hybrida]|nr:hypothetical protein BDD12DRAFT_853601 [Trichophaea hybrida]
MPPKRKAKDDTESSKKQRTSSVDGNGNAWSQLPYTFSDSSVSPDVAIEMFGKTYHLHSTILRLSSGFFDKSLSDTWWKPENSHSGPDGIKYRYKLVLDKKDPWSSILEPSPVSEAGESGISCAESFGVKLARAGGTLSGDNLSKTQDNHSAEAGDSDGKGKTEGGNTDELHDTYICLFRIFYQTSFELSSGVSEELHKIKLIVKLAELYCAMHSVSHRVTMELIAWSARFGELDSYASKIITLASKVRSEILFNDAFVHLVGKWRIHRHHTREIDDNVRYLIDKEYMRIQELKSKVDRKLAYYASNPKNKYDRDAIHSLGQALKSVFEETVFYQRVAAISGNWATETLCPLVEPLLASEIMLHTFGFTYKHLTCAKLNGNFPWGDIE